jgi:hypothetical protein
MEKIPKPTLEKHKNSPWFQQDAFTPMEMRLQQISAFVIAGTLFKVIGLNMGVLGWLIRTIPDPLVGVWGHGPKCICISFPFFIGCLMGSAFVKYIFYQIVGLVLGLTPTTAMDDFWLYDYPINPIIVPSILTFAKPGPEYGTPEQQWEVILKRA